MSYWQRDTQTEQWNRIQTEHICTVNLKMFAMQSIKKKKQTTSFKCIVPGQSNINSGGKKKKKCNGRRVDYYLKS